MLKYLLPIFLLGCYASAQADALPTMSVYTPKVCLACIDWTEHLRKNGFTVTVSQHSESEMAEIKRRLRIPADLQSIPSAEIAGYFIEGHVHADQIKELLQERPKARGLSVPGLPLGAPGREYSSPTCQTACTVLDTESAGYRVRRELYETLLVLPDGGTKTWARH